MSMPAVSRREVPASRDDMVRAVLERVVTRIAERRHVPLATYRLQFNRDFTFLGAAAQADYLERLGVTDVYASPYFRARVDSMHGYDITDHNQLNASIGGDRDYAQMVETLHRHGLRQVLDVVPNHMGIGEPTNVWWMDVLENGQSSVYAPFFDVDWNPLNHKLKGKVLLPILGSQYGHALENQELKVEFDAEQGAFTLRYAESVLPLNPRSYVHLLAPERERTVNELGPDSPAALEYQSIVSALHNMPHRSETEPDKRLERARETQVNKRRLAALCGAEPRVKHALVERVAILNGKRGETRSFDALDALLEEQSYRLSFWRVAAEEINYRRFFDINDLVAIRVDEPSVFEATHRTVIRLLRDGCLDGLRIDHVDGLRDPTTYLVALQRTFFQELCRTSAAELGLDEDSSRSLEPELIEYFEKERRRDPNGPLARPLYVVVEKILARSERLPATWAVAGTTGYEFANDVNGVFVARSNAGAFDEIYHWISGRRVDCRDLGYDKKKQIMRISLASEISMLTNLLNVISERDRHYRDFTLSTLRHAIREVIACFPVYRTYIAPDATDVDACDRAYIEEAVIGAKRRNPAIDPSSFDFVQHVLLLDGIAELQPEHAAARREFVLKFQQCTGPVMAKGLEDTVFYVYNRLISLNEVGGEPGEFGTELSDFHQRQADRLREWPGSMLATSTHDTKRSEDVRARINVLSEIPKEWESALTRWIRYNEALKQNIHGRLVPESSEEYFIYQTLLGVWPVSGREDAAAIPDQEYAELRERLRAYLRKAVNEAKVNSSWINENQAHHDAISNFLASLLERRPDNHFLVDFVAFQRKVAHFGAFNSLSQVLIKLTSPGVPDIYQGNELFAFSLVDPDNRRSVDYDLRRRLLAEVDEVGDAQGAAELVAHKHDGRVKLFVTSRALRHRRMHEPLFREGEYHALYAVGRRADSVCAFARVHRNDTSLTVVPRLLAGQSRAGECPPVTGRLWEGTALVLPGARSGQNYRNVFTGELVSVEAGDGQIRLPLAEVFATFPVALLERTT